MKPTNLTNIDFADIRESIKSYMRTRPEFTDYDFTGSTLSYLLDILAYNTYYSAFNANMALNELFLDSATTRDNVVNLAKLLNYTPTSYRAAYACIDVEVYTEIGNNGLYPPYVLLKKGNVCSGLIGGASYSFCTQEDKIAKVDQTTGYACFKNFAVYEGNHLTYEYTVDKTVNQKYLIPNERVDTSLLKVSVRANAQATQYDTYNIVQNITTIDPLSRVYFLSETNDRRYEVVFGDGILGKELETGQVITLDYITTSGMTANNIQQFAFVGEIVDADNIAYNDATLKLNMKSQSGSAQETLKSIKFNAPRAYAAQNRAVTAKDYENLTKIVYPNAKYVNAFGGETLTPPVYGKVFLSIRTKTGAKLNNLTKKDIVRNLRPYAMASVDIVIEDPNELFVELNVLVITNNFVTTFGDGTLSQSTSEKLKAKALNALQEYGDNEDLSNFDKTFSITKLQTDILKSDTNIQDVLTNISLYKRALYPEESSPQTFNFDFGVSFDCSCSSTPGNSIQSSVYYTTDRPGVPQYFEDDGSGVLRSFTLLNNKKTILDRNVGSYSCDTGKITFGPVNIEGSNDLQDTLANPDNTPTVPPENILYDPGTEIPGIMTIDTVPPVSQVGVIIPTNANNTSYIYVPVGTLPGGGTLPSGGGTFVPSVTGSAIPGTFAVTSPATGVGTFTPIVVAPTGGTGTGSGTGSAGASAGGGGTAGGGSGAGGTGTGGAGTTGGATGGYGGTSTAGSTGAPTSTTFSPISSSLIPTAITVGGAPATLSVSPGTFSPGTTMTFGIPSIAVVPPGSPVIGTFITGGTPGSPGTTGGLPGLPGAIVFTPPPPTTAPPAGGSGCYV